MHAAAPSSSAPEPRNFALGIAPFCFADLFDAQRLAELDATFLRSLPRELAERLAAWRKGDALERVAESELLVALAEPLGDFIARLFVVEPHAQLAAWHTANAQLLLTCKNEFVHKRVRRRRHDAAVIDELTLARLERAWGHTAWAPDGAAVPMPRPEGIALEDDDEARAARIAMRLLYLWRIVDQRPAPTASALTAVRQELSEVLGEPLASETLRERTEALLLGVEAWHRERLGTLPWGLYKQPHAIEPTHQQLLALERHPDGAQVGVQSARRPREGFALTDRRMDRRQALAEVDYCLICHPRGKDSCRTGLRERDGTLKQTPLGVEQGGCPLDERISEAHLLRGRGQLIAALAMVMRDNPMCPGTGHRICNDCMRACIFQRQQPVDIPQVETNILSEVLHMPLGVEIYGLLTRFNPLRQQRPYPRALVDRRVLVVGLGPAGYTLAHYLLQEGYAVVGIDGLKLEPLPDELTGADVWPPRAITHYRELEEALDERAASGFGGVAEYGITVRWDKNFLKLMYLTLARSPFFRAFGGVRFGGTLTLEDAWSHGFDHVALAAGAGRPTLIGIKNNLMRGMRTASDFLMGLQLTGAARRSSLANLQIELPAVVVGGGLTAVDTATEVAAYYPVQIERLAAQVRLLGREVVESDLDDEERATLARMLGHAAELADERAKAEPDVASLLQRWGGVTIAYRRSLPESPAYRLNHEEVGHALAEGVRFMEHVTPEEAVPDAYGHVAGLVVRHKDGSARTLPARAVLMAAGTSPNTIYAREAPGSLKLDHRGRYFATHRWDAGAQAVVPAAPGDAGAFFTNYRAGDEAPGRAPRLVSFFGDNHPHYAGNVVRAMASAKAGHRAIAEVLDATAHEPVAADAHRSWLTALSEQWDAHVVRVERLGPQIIEVVVRAPMAAQKFRPGQFFRLQNFERDAVRLGPMSLSMEGLALTGAWVDAERGELGLIALEMGVSSRLCAHLEPGQQVVLMGPTGAPTEVPKGQKVILCGGGLGNAVLFSVARAMRAAGCKVIYFAAYRSGDLIFKQDEVEAAADQVIFSVDAGPAPTPRRPQDRGFLGNVVMAMQAFAEGKLGERVFDLSEAEHLLAIGSDRMMAAVAQARRTTLAPYLHAAHSAVASINSPMQCMLKEVCAQCLQRHVDPVTGEESFVFSCFNQDQPQDSLDWQNLSARLRQNTLLEKVSGRILGHLLSTHAPSGAQ